MVRRTTQMVLAFWVCITSTLCEVSHAHRYVKSDSAQSVLLDRISRDHSTSSEHGHYHRHLTLLWVESGEIPCCPSSGESEPPSRVAIGFECVSPTLVADCTDSVLLDGITSVPHTSAITFTLDVPVYHSSGTTPVTVPLCANATHSRTGVQIA